MKFILHRVKIHKNGCFGVLMQNDDPPFAVTIERTFKPDNEVVIPFGTHKCTRSTYYKGGYPTYEIHVEGHSRLLFHKGNLEAHSLGCILVGEDYRMFGNIEGIGNSAGGFKEFMKKANSIDKLDLEVV
jgi:hypothetical protein